MLCTSTARKIGLSSNLPGSPPVDWATADTELFLQKMYRALKFLLEMAHYLCRFMGSYTTPVSTT